MAKAKKKHSAVRVRVKRGTRKAQVPPALRKALEDLKTVPSERFRLPQELVERFRQRFQQAPSDYSRIDRAIQYMTGAGLPVSSMSAPASAAAWVNSKTWITDEAQRMKAAGIIPERKTDFAKALAQRMAEAAASGQPVRPVGWRHVMNQLAGWGLWPTDRIIIKPK